MNSPTSPLSRSIMQGKMLPSGSERALRFASATEYMHTLVMSASEEDGCGIYRSAAERNPRHRQSDRSEGSINRRLCRYGTQGTGDALPLAAVQCAGLSDFLCVGSYHE